MNDYDLLRAELLRRKLGRGKKDLWQDSEFAAQARFLNDKHRWKALLCPRRAAKSFTAGLDLMNGALNIPNFNGLYISLTFDSAKEIMWEPVVKVVDAAQELGFQFNETRLIATAPGGGRFRLFGADATEGEIKKVLGGKYHKVYVDEAGSFKQDVGQMFSKYIRPALTDYQGSCCLLSTPTDFTKGLYYDITKAAPEKASPYKNGEWKVYHWHPRDNPFVARQWEEDHASLLAANPLVVNTPAYQQMWQGRWMVDTDALVYKFAPARNVCPVLPKGYEWNYVIGVDLGWRDATAMTVLAWSETNQTTYVVHSEAASEMDFTLTANRIKQLMKRFRTEVAVIDGASAQGVEEMIARHGVPLTRAEKTGKADFQRLLNADLLTERLMVVDGAGTAGLRKEWSELIWEPKARAAIPPRFVEHPGLDNHRSDAALYAWRWTYSHGSKHQSQESVDVARREHEEEIAKALAREAVRNRDKDEAGGWDSSDGGLNPFGEQGSGEAWNGQE